MDPPEHIILDVTTIFLNHEFGGKVINNTVSPNDGYKVFHDEFMVYRDHIDLVVIKCGVRSSHSL